MRNPPKIEVLDPHLPISPIHTETPPQGVETSTPEDRVYLGFTFDDFKKELQVKLSNEEDKGNITRGENIEHIQATQEQINDALPPLHLRTLEDLRQCGIEPQKDRDKNQKHLDWFNENPIAHSQVQEHDWVPIKENILDETVYCYTGPNNTHALTLSNHARVRFDDYGQAYITGSPQDGLQAFVHAVEKMGQETPEGKLRFDGHKLRFAGYIYQKNGTSQEPYSVHSLDPVFFTSDGMLVRPNDDGTLAHYTIDNEKIYPAYSKGIKINGQKEIFYLKELGEKPLGYLVSLPLPKPLSQTEFHNHLWKAKSRQQWQEEKRQREESYKIINREDPRRSETYEEYLRGNLPKEVSLPVINSNPLAKDEAQLGEKATLLPLPDKRSGLRRTARIVNGLTAAVVTIAGAVGVSEFGITGLDAIKQSWKARANENMSMEEFLDHALKLHMSMQDVFSGRKKQMSAAEIKESVRAFEQTAIYKKIHDDTMKWLLKSELGKQNMKINNTYENRTQLLGFLGNSLVSISDEQIIEKDLHKTSAGMALLNRLKRGDEANLRLSEDGKTIARISYVHILAAYAGFMDADIKTVKDLPRENALKNAQGLPSAGGEDDWYPAKGINALRKKKGPEDQAYRDREAKFKKLALKQRSKSHAPLDIEPVAQDTTLPIAMVGTPQQRVNLILENDRTLEPSQKRELSQFFEWAITNGKADLGKVFPLLPEDPAKRAVALQIANALNPPKKHAEQIEASGGSRLRA